MHLFRSHRLKYVQVPQVVSDLIFSYDGKDFIPSGPPSSFRDLRNVGREMIVENWGRIVFSTSAFCGSGKFVTNSLVLFTRVGTFSLIFLIWSTYLWKPFLSGFASFAKFSSNCTLAFLIPSLRIQGVSLYSPEDTHPWFHCLCSIVTLYSDQEVLTQPCWSPAFLARFLTHSSCTSSLFFLKQHERLYIMQLFFFVIIICPSKTGNYLHITSSCKIIMWDWILYESHVRTGNWISSWACSCFVFGFCAGEFLCKQVRTKNFSIPQDFSFLN